ncbi:lipocalin family protein [Polaribacter litorisediminis]|uniref:lipocalin family protein n=1 Tax=Polaribacter litorisediminis TaxID=1908341 RepID=UPI001CBB7189|nr:lipocalin family protein [Polaribacter litorisediminis]UAM98934.1 lipocalin family protein [Polaribacter litorisediminis]
MKKIIYLLTIIIGLSSCSSSDDDDTTLAKDSLIGTWQLTSSKEAGVETSTECTRKNTLTFLENSNASVLGFYEEDNVCESESGTFTWVSNGNSNYTFNFGGGNTETYGITFSQNNTVFSVTIDTNEVETYQKN